MVNIKKQLQYVCMVFKCSLEQIYWADLLDKPADSMFCALKKHLTPLKNIRELDASEVGVEALYASMCLLSQETSNWEERWCNEIVSEVGLKQLEHRDQQEPR